MLTSCASHSLRKPGIARTCRMETGARAEVLDAMFVLSSAENSTVAPTLSKRAFRRDGIRQVSDEAALELQMESPGYQPGRSRTKRKGGSNYDSHHEVRDQVDRGRSENQLLSKETLI